MISSKSDLTALLDTLIASHTAEWVTGHQPVDWRRRTWGILEGPRPALLQRPGLTRRGDHRPRHYPQELHLLHLPGPQSDRAVHRRHGLGERHGRRSLARIRTILAQPDAAHKIQATVDTVRQHGAAAGYKSYSARTGSAS